MNPSKPLFLAFEGIDGSGKSTHSRLLSEKLNQLHHKTYTTCEPTDSEIGQLIRRILKGERKADHKTLAGLFVADRLDHILDTEKGLLKQLNDGYHVITDRYYFSSYAYHSTHMDMDWVIAANSMSADLLRPTATIFVDVAPEICIERIQKSRANIELFETLDLLKAIRSNYLTAFEKLAGLENVVHIDGNRDMSVVADEIFAYVNTLLV
jgi:dTMP kinase